MNSRLPPIVKHCARRRGGAMLISIRPLRWRQQANSTRPIASIRNYMASVAAGSAEHREAQNKIYALEAKKEMAAARKSPSLAGDWKVFVNGRPQRAGDSAGEGTWVRDFHYRFEVRGEEIVAYRVSDSDPILDSFDKTWCRRAGGAWACTGDEDMFGQFSVDHNAIRGRFLLNNLNGDLSGTFSETEIRWDYEYKDQYGVHRSHETLRKLAGDK